MSIIVPLLSERIGNSAVFLFFGSLSLLTLVYMCIFIKDTTYTFDETDGKEKRIRLLTDREKKELYMPEEFKSNKKK
jgi:hypothetical protein